MHRAESYLCRLFGLWRPLRPGKAPVPSKVPDQGPALLVIYHDHGGPFDAASVELALDKSSAVFRLIFMQNDFQPKSLYSIA
jgi:hypothetical protein